MVELISPPVDLTLDEPPTCPECGIDLTDKDAYGHSLTHWPQFIPFPEANADAIARQKLLRDLFQRRGY